ncbi:hypothetical protein HUJ05_001798 [Dendroctonus ponderosae]|nr:hypothetical protein HUJ05_001798 [Dendroctonus ponderosae]
MYLGGSDAEVFKYRKGYFSINVQAIGDAGLKLMNVVARWPGSTHDATIFNNSKEMNEADPPSPENLSMDEFHYLIESGNVPRIASDGNENRNNNYRQVLIDNYF